MQPTTNFDASKLARSLLRRSRQGALATLMPESGDPYCSLVNVASHADASPILLISRLALHTKNILGDSRVSLMLDERAAGDPLEGARIMLAGRAEEASGEAAKILRRRYLNAHPSAEAFVDFKDFSFFRIAPSGLHLVAGFGRIIDLKPEQFLTGIGDAAELLEAEQGAVEHMNEDHREAMNLYATQTAGSRIRRLALHRLRSRRHGHAGRKRDAAARFPGTGHQRHGVAQDAGAAGGRGAGQRLTSTYERLTLQLPSEGRKADVVAVRDASGHAGLSQRCILASQCLSGVLGAVCADRGAPRVEIFLIVHRSNFRRVRQRRMVAQPRRQTHEKRCSIRLIQINRRRANKPNRVDRLGKHRVHQY